MTNKRCPQGSAKNVLLFVEQILLRWLGYNPFASINTFLTRTKFNQQRSTGPSQVSYLTHNLHKSRCNPSVFFMKDFHLLSCKTLFFVFLSAFLHSKLKVFCNSGFKVYWVLIYSPARRSDCTFLCKVNVIPVGNPCLRCYKVLSCWNNKAYLPLQNDLKTIGVIMEVHEYENAYYQVKDDVLESLPCDEE